MSPPPGGIVNARAVEINFGRRIKPPDLFLNRFQLLRFKPHEGKVPKKFHGRQFTRCKSEIWKADPSASAFQISARIDSVAQGQVHADLIVVDVAADGRLDGGQIIVNLAGQVPDNFRIQA